MFFRFSYLYTLVILPDRSMAQIYQRIHNYLDEISNIPNYPLVIISITGGSRDRIVSIHSLY